MDKKTIYGAVLVLILNACTNKTINPSQPSEPSQPGQPANPSQEAKKDKTTPPSSPTKKIADDFKHVQHEGSHAGNGVNYTNPNEGAAWYAYQEKVMYCIMDAGFVINDRAQLVKYIDRSFQKWKDYIRNKLTFISSKNDKLVAKKLADALSSDFVYQDNCSLSTDLYFFFGQRPQGLFKETMYANRVAFAKKLETPKGDNENRFNGRGIVWLNHQLALSKDMPDWTKRHSLEGVILHEIGHIFGCEHTAETVMDANYYLNTSNALDFKDAKKMTLSIDGNKELYLCPDCGFVMEGNIPAEGHELIFKKKATLSRYATAIKYGPTPEQISIKTTDPNTNKPTTLEIHRGPLIGSYKESTELFKTMTTGMLGLFSDYLRSGGFVSKGVLVTEDKKTKLDVYINGNMQQRLAIYTIVKKKRTPLYFSGGWYDATIPQF